MNDVAQVRRAEDAGTASSGRGASPRRTRSAARRPHPSQHYFAFLSYSHDDQATAEWLHESIENFRVPKRLVGKLAENGVVPRRLTPVFRDRGELAASDDLTEEIEEALAGSRFMIVLCSPAAVASRWTNAEIAAFKRLHPEGEIFAAIVGGEPFASDIPGREAEECFPPALLQRYDRRGRPTAQRAEPIAADLRAEGDGKRLGLMKIIAGMLGVGLDDLVQREGQRRQRRMQLIAAASLAGMVFTSGLSLVAIQSRDAARDQRREAEGLVAFMLGDLKEKLEPIGRLDALDGVGSRVLAYYSKQDMSELSDAGLLQRSRALSLTAQVANLRGDVGTAQQLYRQALHGTAEAVRRNPDDPQRLFDHAQNVFYLGEIARRRGDIRGMDDAAREYKRLALRMTALEPDNLRWRMESAYGDVNLGIVSRNQRRFPEAARQFASALAVMEGVASIDRGNAEYQRELANLLGWAADAERDQGDLEAAIRIRQRQIAFLRQLIAGGAANVKFRERLVPAHQGLGILLSWTRGPGSAIDQLRLGVAESNRLIGIEPENTVWKGFGAQVRLELANALFSANRTADAVAEARAGCDLAAQVLAQNPGPTWRRLQTVCLTLQARLAMQADENAAALSYANRALASARSEQDEDPTRDKYGVAAAYRLLGDVRRRMGDADAASASWTSGLAQLPRNVGERPSEMMEHAELLRRLGRLEEARLLTARLAAMGYRSAA